MEHIEWSDFEKVEIRVGTILSVSPFPKAIKPAYQIQVDFGEFGVRHTSAQITALYAPASLIGRQVLCVVNFPPKQIANFRSEFLLTGVYVKDGVVTIVGPDHPVPNGTRLA